MPRRNDVATRFAAAEACQLGPTLLPQPFALPESAFGPDSLQACHNWASHAADLFDLAGLIIDSETGWVEVPHPG